jgi:xylulokinase
LANQLVLGIDVGTSSVKALFLEPYGSFVARDEAKLPIHRDGKEVEQNPLDYLNAVKELAKRNSELLKKVVAIGLSGQTPTVVCVDAEGNPTLPALIWQDNRAEEEARLLAQHFGNPLHVIGTSLPWSASACPAKMMWISKHRKEEQRKTRWVLQPKDFVGMHLTGRAISDPWSSKGLCNVKTREAIDELLEFVGWSSQVSPELADGYESRGEVTKESAEQFGIPAGIPVSVGWSDAMTGMLALGVMTEPRSFIITGTSAIVGVSSRHAPDDGGNLYVIPQTCAPLAVTYGPTQMSGGSISWMSKILNVTEDELVEMGNSDTSESVPIYLPYINGERAPLWNSEIRGRFIGMDIAHEQSSFARSVMEGISWAENQVMLEGERLTRSQNTEVVLGGHAGNDARWEKTRSRTIGRSLLRFEDADTTTRGSAMLAYTLITNNLQRSFEALSISPKRSEPDHDDISYSSTNFPRFISAQNSLLQDQLSEGKS